MRKTGLALCSVFLFAPALLAQNKIETKWHCPKSTTEQKLDVGDMPDHSYRIAQGTCSATASGEFQEKSGTYTEFDDVKKGAFTQHGVLVVTMADGDKVNYNYTGSASTDTKKPASNKWTVTNGTGKYKGGKGSGTCSGKMNQDGSSDWDCTGTYTAAAK